MLNIQPAVKKETINVAITTTIGVILMWIVFVLLSVLLPEFWAFEFTVIPSGIVGGFVAVLNFLLMGVTVQKVAACEDENMARNYMKASYSRRMLLQAAWIVIAIAAPCFQFIAGILPLIFPSIGIKLVGIYRSKKNS